MNDKPKFHLCPKESGLSLFSWGSLNQCYNQARPGPLSPAGMRSQSRRRPMAFSPGHSILCQTQSLSSIPQPTLAFQSKALSCLFGPRSFHSFWSLDGKRNVFWSWSDTTLIHSWPWFGIAPFWLHVTFLGNKVVSLRMLIFLNVSISTN